MTTPAPAEFMEQIDAEYGHRAAPVAPNAPRPELGTYHAAATIARALTTPEAPVNKKYIQRLAQREGWPARAVGNRFEYLPPAHIARIIVAVPVAATQATTSNVTFADLAHSDAQREKVLRREQAVKRVQENQHLGKEVALTLVVQHFRAEYPLFPCSVSSLRNWLAAYEQRGIDGLVEQKRGRVGRKGFAVDLEEEAILRGRAMAIEHGIKGRTNVARAYRNLVADPTINGPARHWLHGANASKSYVPPSVRAALRTAPLAVKFIQQGPKAAKLDGPFTECHYENVAAGRAFTADDMTANVYVWCEWPNEDGYLLIRPQILAAMDVGSMAWLNVRAVMRPKGQYNKDDVWGLLGDVMDAHGLHLNAQGKVDAIAVLEGGTWQSGVVVGTKTGVTDEERFGGLRSLGVQVIHTRTPRGKIIETAFNQLQHAADTCKGFCGRMEMKDCPEAVKEQLALVRSHKAHPRQFFLHISEYKAHLAGVMHALNHERNDGKILRGRAPVDKWAEDAPQMLGFPATHKWMYRAAYRVCEVTRNGVRVTVGSGKYMTAYTYENPEQLEAHRGRRVVCYWNDYDPDTDAVIYSLRNGRPDKLICVASRLAAVPRFGATADQIAAEASRKKLSQQLVRTERAALTPFLSRPAHAARPTPVNPGETIEQVRAAHTAKARTQQQARRFQGDAAELLSPGEATADANANSRAAEMPAADDLGDVSECQDTFQPRHELNTEELLG